MTLNLVQNIMLYNGKGQNGFVDIGGTWRHFRKKKKCHGA